MTTAARTDTWYLRFLRRGVFKHLSIALHDSKSALSCEWVDRDPDLRAMHNDPEWTIVMQRYCGDADRVNPEWRDVSANARRLVDEMERLHGHPDRPWGDPERRRIVWTVIAVALATAALIRAAFPPTGTGWAGPGLVGLLAALAAVRALVLAQEAARTSEPQAPTATAGSRWIVAGTILAGVALFRMAVGPSGTEWIAPLALAVIVLMSRAARW
jgi:hypothetical protein